MSETKEQKVVRLARAGVERAVGERRGFTITKLGRHEDGYFHARITPAGGKPIYVHRRYGSWMAPGKFRGREVMKELESLRLPPDAKVELQRKARALERAERGEINGSQSKDGSESDAEPDAADDSPDSDGSIRRGGDQEGPT